MFGAELYGLNTPADLFTPRQLVALTTFSDLVQEARERVKQDALAAGMADDGLGLDAGGIGATAYADAVAVYLALAVSKLSDAQCYAMSLEADNANSLLRHSDDKLFLWFGTIAEANAFGRYWQVTFWYR